MQKAFCDRCGAQITGDEYDVFVKAFKRSRDYPNVPDALEFRKDAEWCRHCVHHLRVVICRVSQGEVQA